MKKTGKGTWGKTVYCDFFMFQFLFYPLNIFIVSVYLLKCLSLAFISLNIVGEVIKGSKQESDSVQFTNPSQSSMQRASALFSSALGGSEQTKVPGEDISSILCDSLLDLGFKTNRLELIDFSFLFMVFHLD